MRASRHNGRSGKHGVYDVKHNDRNFDVINSEHIDVNRTMQNVYWDCYQGYCLNGVIPERKMTFSEVEKLYYFEHYGDHVTTVLGWLPSRRYCREICSGAFSNALSARSQVPDVNIYRKWKISSFMWLKW